MSADGFPQFEVPAGWAVIQFRDRCFARAAQKNAPPPLKGEDLQVAPAVGEIVAKRTHPPRRKVDSRPGGRCCGSKAREARLDRISRPCWAAYKYGAGGVGSR